MKCHLRPCAPIIFRLQDILQAVLRAAFGLAVLVLGGQQAQAQATGDFRSHGSGNWNATTTWDRYDGSSWINPAPNTPASADGVITILSNHIVNITANVTSDQVVVSLRRVFESMTSSAV